MTDLTLGKRGSTRGMMIAELHGQTEYKYLCPTDPHLAGRNMNVNGNSSGKTFWSIELQNRLRYDVTCPIVLVQYFRLRDPRMLLGVCSPISPRNQGYPQSLVSLLISAAGLAADEWL